MIIDILLFIFALTGFWWGYTQGIVRTLLMIVAYVAAILVTLKISPWVMDFLHGTFNIGLRPALIFGTIFMLLLLIIFIHWLAKRLKASFAKGKLSGSDKIFGGLIMMVVGMLFYSLVLWPINHFGMIGEKSKTSSFTYVTLEAVPVKAQSFISGFKPLFSRYWQLMEESIQKDDIPSPE